MIGGLVSITSLTLFLLPVLYLLFPGRKLDEDPAAASRAPAWNLRITSSGVRKTVANVLVGRERSNLWVKI